jgi:hypothetical protein
MQIIEDWPKVLGSGQSPLLDTERGDEVDRALWVAMLHKRFEADPTRCPKCERALWMCRVMPCGYHHYREPATPSVRERVYDIIRKEKDPGEKERRHHQRLADRTYGTRPCVICGKIFPKGSNSAQVCGPECRTVLRSRGR